MFTRFSLIAVIVMSGFFYGKDASIAAFVPDPTPPPKITQPSGTR
jgi:hypothetical protein